MWGEQRGHLPRVESYKPIEWESVGHRAAFQNFEGNQSTNSIGNGGCSVIDIVV